MAYEPKAYEPVNMAGLIAPATSVTIDYRGSSNDVYILTEIIVANSAATPEQITIGWTNNDVDIHLFDEVTLPAHGTANLNCYIPLKASNQLKCFASNSGVMHVTINGLKVVTV